MSIDVSQFHQVFFEESQEGLSQMETILLDAKGSDPDPERINALFRVVHSIKGGGGTFGFDALTTFAHKLETLMDAVRHDELPWTDDLIPLLLESTDTLRHILQSLELENEIDPDLADDLVARLQLKLDSNPLTAESSVDDNVTPIDIESNTKSDESLNVDNKWVINFRPYPGLFHTGNDPARLFNELSEMGTLEVHVDDSKLPEFTELEPEDCFLSWELHLTTDSDEKAIRDVFDWVELDCDLEVNRFKLEDIQSSSSEEVLLAENTSRQETVKVSNSESEVSSEPINKTESTPTTDVIVESGESSSEKGSVENKSTAPVSNSIRVETDKIDALINMVGELVITQSMLAQMGKDLTEQTPSVIIDGIEELERNTRHLQEGIMQIRMLPIKFAFNRFPRLVFDLSAKMGKKVVLKTTGEQTELDKSVMEKIGDPLVHLVRNSLDHGLESPEIRLAKNKSETGTIHLNAYQQGGNIVVEIIDDGAGLNTEKILSKAIEKGLVSADDKLTKDDIHNLIFLPGFSTADQVSDISGRGVGMDVVRRNITGLGGSVDVKSEEGKGSSFTIRLPLTLAIMDGQSFQVAAQRYIIPLLSIVETVEIKAKELKRVTGRGELYMHRQEYLPVIRLQEIFNLPKHQVSEESPGLLVILENGRRRISLFVDDLHGQQQVVIKSLETNFRKVPGISAATILGDGSVALILDIPGIWEMHKDNSHQIKKSENTLKDDNKEEAVS